MTNRRESYLVEKIDRDAERSAERGRLVGEARAHVAAFVDPFHLPEERAMAADALAQALAPVLTETAGAVTAANRFGALTGRAAKLPNTRGGRVW